MFGWCLLFLRYCNIAIRCAVLWYFLSILKILTKIQNL